jgi:hypothetical protein
MLKKGLFVVFGLVMALAFVNPPKAHAGVAIGVTVGGPVYVRPAYPYAYVYYPRPYPPVYVYPRPYVYRGPVVYGNFYHGPYGHGGRWEHERFERGEHFEHRGYYDHDRR